MARRLSSVIRSEAPCARLSSQRKSRDRGSASSDFAPCPLSGEEANPARVHASSARSQSHPVINVGAWRPFMKKLYRSLLGSVLGAGLAAGDGAGQAKDLTLCWAAWDPANALVELS